MNGDIIMMTNTIPHLTSNFFIYVHYFNNLPQACLVTSISCYGRFVPFLCDALCPVAPSNTQGCIPVSSFELSGEQLEPSALCFPTATWAETNARPLCFLPINHPTQVMECNGFCFFTAFWGHVRRAKAVLLWCTLPSILNSQNITLASVFNISLV